MNCGITVPYSVYFSGVVREFVSQMSEAYGASSTEKMQMSLATEEIFSYIVAGFPYEEKEEFNLRCRVENNGLVFLFSNKGIPVNARRTAEYNPQNVDMDDLNNLDKNIESLNLALAKEMVDKLDFYNHGNDGWIIVAKKRFENFKVPYLKLESADDKGLDKKFTSVTITSDMIPELTALVYNTYRYTYAKNIFYDEARLEKALVEQKIISLGVKNRQEKMIGSISIFFDEPLLAEIGAIMVEPDYRQSMGLLLLFKHCKKIVLQELDPSIIFYSKLVTTHTASQRLLYSTKLFTTLGFRLSVHENAKFIGINDEEGKEKYRESLLYVASRKEKVDELKKFYLPEKLKNVATPMLDDFFKWDMIDEFCEVLENTQAKQAIIEGDNFAELWVENIGADFNNWLKEKNFSLQQEGVVTCLMHLPIDKKWPEGTEEILDSNHYFFSGIHFNHQGDPMLMYTNLFYQKFDFASVNLSDDKAKELLKYVEEEYFRVRQ